MPVYSDRPAVREDFRCGLCRQKNVFHCEHDTPYRDRYLGAYDQERIDMDPNDQRRQPRGRSGYNGSHAGPYDGMQSSRTTDAGFQSSRRSDGNSTARASTHGHVKANEHHQKKKQCCVIL
jgi:hypothetical protein